jgi:predicted transcriptional regulator
MHVHLVGTEQLPGELDGHVSEHMTPASALVTVAPSLTCDEADELARSNGVHHLLVASAGRLVGVVCRCDLRQDLSDAPISGLLKTDVFAIGAHEPLAAAARAMAELRIGCLPVVAEDLLVGVITRSDLEQAGVPRERLRAPVCASCGGKHGVRCSQHAGLCVCIECRDLLDEFFDPRTFGEGD